MNAITIKVRPWENSVSVPASQELVVGDVVIVQTREEMASAIVEKIIDEPSEELMSQNDQSIKFLRKASSSDINIINDYKKKSQEAIQICHEEVKKVDLPMKIVNAQYSLDGSGITFAFVSDGRVDFRDLVKNLSKLFQRSVRLHQIGARDESRQAGGYGICGRELCCVKFKGDLPSITSEMAKIQQIAHRGSERISGLCGRLMCCLSYEASQYKEMLEKFPKLGDAIKYQGQSAIVRDLNVLSQEIRLELPDKSLVTVKISDIK